MHGARCTMHDARCTMHGPLNVKYIDHICCNSQAIGCYTQLVPAGLYSFALQVQATNKSHQF